MTVLFRFLFFLFIFVDVFLFDSFTIKSCFSKVVSSLGHSIYWNCRSGLVMFCFFPLVVENIVSLYQILRLFWLKSLIYLGPYQSLLIFFEVVLKDNQRFPSIVLPGCLKVNSIKCWIS